MIEDRERTCRADELELGDIGRRISFDRIASDHYDRPRVTGELLAISPRTYLVGNMQRQGFDLRIGFPRRFGGLNIETVGPIPVGHQVEVGRPMRRTKDRFEL